VVTEAVIYVRLTPVTLKAHWTLAAVETHGMSTNRTVTGH